MFKIKYLSIYRIYLIKKKFNKNINFKVRFKDYALKLFYNSFLKQNKSIIYNYFLMIILLKKMLWENLLD